MKIKELLEARGSYFIRNNNQKSAISVIMGSSSNPASFMILSENIDGNAPLHFFKVNTAKFKRLRAIGFGYGVPEFDSLSSEDRLNLYNNFVRYVSNPAVITKQSEIDLFLETYNKFKNIIGTAVQDLKFQSMQDLAKFMITKGKVDPQIVQRVTGISVDTDLSSDIVVGKSKIVFPDNMRETRKEAIVDLIKKSNDSLAKHGLENLTNTVISIRPINGRTIGFYNIESKTIVVDPAAKVSYMAIHTIVHEYAHKLWFEVMSEEQRTKVKEKYREEYGDLLKNLSSKDVSQAAKEESGYDSEIKKLFDGIDVGDRIEYTGRSANYKKHSPFIVTNKSGGRLELKPENGYGKVAGPIGAFVGKGFVHDGKVIALPKATSEQPREYKPRDGWFPTQYSEKDAEEWFAELFAFYILGDLTYKPAADFIKSVI